MDFSKYDASVFILLNNGEIVYDELNTKDITKIKFIMLTNDYLNPDYGEDNTIFMSIDCTEQINSIMRKKKYSIKWFNSDNGFIGSEIIDYDGQLKISNQNNNLSSMIVNYDGKSPFKLLEIDFDGYLNTQNILTNCPPITDGVFYHRQYNDFEWKYLSKEDTIPAVMSAFNSKVRYKGRNIHGYLPAISQLFCLGININKVNDVLNLCQKESFIIQNRESFDKTNHDVLKICLWSSTINSNKTAFIYNKGNAYFIEMCSDTVLNYSPIPIKVLPFYKITI